MSAAFLGVDHADLAFAEVDAGHDLSQVPREGAGWSWFDSRCLAGLSVAMRSAGDEGEGVGAATVRTAPRPQTLGGHRTRTRMVSMGGWYLERCCSSLKMLGRDQPRDSHFHGAPHVRAEQTALLGAYTQGVCSS